MLLRKWATVLTAGALLSLLPLGIGQLDTDTFTADGSVVTVSTACGQAEECEEAENYICSKEDGDKMDHKCSAGCNSVQRLQ